ncbi:hypothetical protein ED050_16860 [Escherichia coli]|nr:hypothetical protein [Escherichia coli]
MLRTFIVIIFIFNLSGCGYNDIQTYDEQVNASWSEVLNQYQRRADLIPNLVASIKGYSNHEKDVLEAVTLARSQALMNPLMILVKIIKLRWIHILSYDQMVSRKINNQTTRCANSIFYTTLFTNSAPNYT